MPHHTDQTENFWWYSIDTVCSLLSYSYHTWAQTIQSDSKTGSTQLSLSSWAQYIQSDSKTGSTQLFLSSWAQYIQSDSKTGSLWCMASL